MPKSRKELKTAVDACTTYLSRVGDCTVLRNHLHGPIGEWDVSQVTDMNQIFYGKNSFNSGISKWKMSSVTTMQGMFYGATSFNINILKWDVSGVTNMQDMFSGATSFNSDISNWDVSAVKTMEGMFSGATSFNIDISQWDVSSVTTMDNIFRGATSFARILCGAAWLESKATKDYMFTRSSGGLCFGCENPILMHTKITSTHHFYRSAPPLHSSHLNRDLNNASRPFPPLTS